MGVTGHNRFKAVWNTSSFVLYLLDNDDDTVSSVVVSHFSDSLTVNAERLWLGSAGGIASEYLIDQ